MRERMWEIMVRNPGMKLLAASATLIGLGCSGGDVTAPSTGSLEITTSTSGPEPDANGYAVTIDGGAAANIAVNGTDRRDDLESGSHRVELVDLAANCTVEGDNPRTVSIAAGATATVEFTVTCGPPPPTQGSLTITTTTSGPAQDPDGYTFSVDGGATQSIAINSTSTVGNLTIGSHSVVLSGMASNCQVAGENPRVITVNAGATATTTFSVTCHLTQGSKIAFIRLSEDGNNEIFTMNADGGDQRNLTPNTGDNRLATNSPNGGWSPDGTKLLFMRFAQSGDAIFVINADGSGESALTDPLAYGSIIWVAWSPDGKKIAFTSNRGDGEHVYVMNADGSGQTLLATDASDPEWSPDGSRIAFVGACISVMNPDGSGQTTLTCPVDNSEAFGLAWSPDSRKIAFHVLVFSGESDFITDNKIWITNADGTGAAAITRYPAVRPIGSPVWAPDGSRLAFAAAAHAKGPWDIYGVRPDGTGLSNLSKQQYLNAVLTDWSPDGTRMLFYARVGSSGASNWDVFAMDADGSHISDLTNNPADDSGGIWQP